jgi:hypothetical protein
MINSFAGTKTLWVQYILQDKVYFLNPETLFTCWNQPEEIDEWMQVEHWELGTYYCM